MQVTITQKTETIFNKNTFYFINSEFETDYQEYIESLILEVLELQLKIKKYGCTEKVIGDLIEENNGFILISACNGISFEILEGIVTYIRIKDDEKINTFFNKDKWDKDIIQKNGFKKWNIDQIQKLVKKNKYFKECIVKIFFSVYNIPEFKNILQPFEFQKLNPSKLNSIATLTSDVIDTLLRNKLKGSYVARKENNAEIVVETTLDESNIPYTRGDLPLLSQNEKTRKRTMDFIIPNKENPKLIIECSYVCTTSSGLGDKAKTENGMKDLIEEYYPEAKFIGFIDGIGWISRDKDAKRMCEAFDDVYTYHSDELERFKETLKEILPEYYKNA